MTKTLAGSFLIAAAMLLASCAAPPKVQTTADPQADLSRYRTFAFLDSDPKAAGGITDKLANDRLRRMISSQLGTRGYVPVASAGTADLGVHYSGRVAEKQSVLMVGRPGPYDYSWGRTELGGYSTMDYREGALFIDIVDLAKNQLLWRTQISEAFSAGYSDENWQKVDRALDEAFKNVPQRR
jgi:hypothetical protein